jgi:hypothetical protein
MNKKHSLRKVLSLLMCLGTLGPGLGKSLAVHPTTTTQYTIKTNKKNQAAYGGTSTVANEAKLAQGGDAAWTIGSAGNTNTTKGCVLTKLGFLINPQDMSVKTLEPEGATVDNDSNTLTFTAVLNFADGAANNATKPTRFNAGLAGKMINVMNKQGANLSDTAPKPGNDILSTDALGTTTFIDHDGNIRNKDGEYLAVGGLTATDNCWTKDAMNKAPALTKDSIVALGAANLLSAKVAYESIHAEKIHLDTEGKLRNDNDELCDLTGKKLDDESGAIKPNGTWQKFWLKEYYQTYDQWRSELSDKYKSTNDLLKSGKADTWLVIRTLKFRKGNAKDEKPQKIDVLMNFSGNLIYCQDAQWREPKTAIESQNPSERPMDAETACKTLKINKAKLKKCGNVRWDNTKRSVKALVIGAPVAAAVAGATVGTVKAVSMVSSNNSPSKQGHQNELKPVPGPRFTLEGNKAF